MAQTVTLTDREGRKCVVSSPLVLNQLVLTQGYQLPDGVTLDDAAAALGPDAPAQRAELDGDTAPDAVQAVARPRAARKPTETSGEDAGDSKTD